jgi:hypothetical protein
MGEQYAPRIPNPFMETDVTFGGVRLKIRGSIANLQSHRLFLLIAIAYR